MGDAGGRLARQTKIGGVLILAPVAAAVATSSIAATALLGVLPTVAAIVLTQVFGIETPRNDLDQITFAELASPTREPI